MADIKADTGTYRDACQKKSKSSAGNGKQGLKWIDIVKYVTWAWAEG